MIRIYPYKAGSRSVRALRDNLEDAKIIRLRNSSYRPREEHTIINWGNSRTPSWLSDVDILNHPESVLRASDKLLTLTVLDDKGVSVIDYTDSPETAELWLSEGHKVFVRHTVTGHSGEGVEVLTPPNWALIDRISDLVAELDESIANDIQSDIDSVLESHGFGANSIPKTPLYTKGIQNHGEYRVHVFKGEVILYQKKSRRVDEEGNVVTPEGEEADVRNLESNWVYRTGNLRRLERIEQLAIDAIKALDLDFGAVDIIKDENGDVFVLEVNTAPGLRNQATLEAYTNAINNLNN